MRDILRRFHRCESGAVTVDWVVLTASMVGFGALVVLGVSQAATEPADSVGNFLNDREIRN